MNRSVVKWALLPPALALFTLVMFAAPEPQLAAEAASVLVVEVRDATGAPISGCFVMLKQRRLPDSRITQDSAWWSAFLEDVSHGLTGEDGECSLEGLAEGRYEIHLVGDRVHAEPLQVELSGRSERVCMEVTLLASVSGLCVDGNSRPLRGVDVTLRREWDTCVELGKYTARSNWDGRFLLKNIPIEAGSRDTIGLRSHYHHDSHSRDVDLQPGASLDVGTFTFLERKSSVNGNITHPDGVPARLLQLELQRVGEEKQHRTQCDQNGRFHFRGLHPGDYVLRAEPYCLEGSESHQLTIARELGYLDLGKLSIRRGSRELRGTVVDGSGALLAGARVSLGNAGMTTDAAGTFSLHCCELCRRTITVSWTPPGELSGSSVQTEFDREELERPVVLTLIRRGVLLQLIDRETGEEVREGAAHLAATTDHSGISRSFANLTGSRMRFQDLEPGEWRFKVSVEGYRAWSRNEQIGIEIRETEKLIEVLLQKE